MSREQLARKNEDADIIPIYEKEILRDTYLKYSLGAGKEIREEVGKLNQEIAGLDEELEILKTALEEHESSETKFPGKPKKKEKKKRILSEDEVISIREAIADLRFELQNLGRKRFMLETKITPDANELQRIRHELKERGGRES
jgi:predicted  nucleic acid-binding Zn-ribbon protein